MPQVNAQAGSKPQLGPPGPLLSHGDSQLDPVNISFSASWGSGVSLTSTVCQSPERSIIGLCTSVPAESLLEVRVLHSDCLFLVDLSRMGPTVRPEAQAPDRRSHNT